MASLISAGPFATEGERRAADLLKQLPAHWVVVCNKTLVTADQRSFEIDFIVIADNHVFVLDEKSWKGKITGDDQTWIRSSGSTFRSPITAADYVAKVLAGHIRARLPEIKGFFVRSGVLLSLADTLPAISDPRLADQVFLPTTVLQRLPAVDAQSGTGHVAQHRAAIQQVLYDLSPRPHLPTYIHLYRIEEQVGARPGCRLLRATLEDQGERLLMVYDLSRDPTAAAALRDFYLREFKALWALRTTGLVPAVGEPVGWGDDFLVLPITPARGTPLASVPLPQGPDALRKEVRLFTTVLEGLAQIHATHVVHRALSPDSIYVSAGATKTDIRFTNFFAARLDAHSIASALDALATEAPYAPPELAAGYGAATPGSDVFSVALIFLERLSRLPLTRLYRAGSVTVPDFGAILSALPDDTRQALHALLGAMLSRVVGERPSAAEAALQLRALSTRLDADTVVGSVLNHRYQVIRILGRGTSACTYLVTDMDYEGQFAVKQFFDPSVVLQQAKSEFAVLRHITHPNLPRVYDAFKPEEDVHLKLEFVAGPTLQELESEFPWPLDKWRPFAMAMLAALGELEAHHLLHRDIKPSNIILREDDGRPVLIDFGFATPTGLTVPVAGAPLYLPPEAFGAEQPPASTDRYALAIVLYHALTGRLPFDLAGSERTPFLPPDNEPVAIRPLAAVLLRALDNDPAQRPASAEELRTALQSAISAGEGDRNDVELPDLVNPWVDQVRGLYRNSESGNADNRGLDSAFVRATYVPTTLDAALLPHLLTIRPRLLFLSGNPGDGKTAFLEQVKQELARHGGAEVQADASGWEWHSDGHTFRACYDASESHNGFSADAQLAHRLRGLEGDAPPEVPVTVLVAINDGRLADFFARHAATYPWVREALEDHVESSENPVTVWTIDLKKRAFVAFEAAPAPSVFRRVLQSLVAEPHWSMCQGCAARAVCPVVTNAAALRRADVGARLEHLLVLHHLWQQRHLTMRDLRSALAYLITANTSCATVHAARKGEADVALIDLSYWRSAFAPRDIGDELMADLQRLDPARFPQPRLERYLHFRQQLSDAPARAQLFTDHTDVSPHRFGEEGEWVAAAKRRLYFESAEDHLDSAIRPNSGVPLWRALLPYQYADQFISLLAGKASLTAARDALARGVLYSDGVTIPSPQDKLSVSVTYSAAQQLVVLKQFALDEFDLLRGSPESKMVETIPDYLIFVHVSGTPRLKVTLDLFELLMRMSHGLRPDAPEFRPLLEDLLPFKSTLLLRETRELVLIENQSRVHRITQRDGKIIRADQVDAEGAP